MNQHKLLYIFRKIAIAEGISYLLFAVTMPLKYGLDVTTPNKVVGMAHGILFMAYILLALGVAYLLKWNLIRTGLVLLASLLPFATFFVDKKILKPEANRL